MLKLMDQTRQFWSDVMYSLGYLWTSVMLAYRDLSADDRFRVAPGHSDYHQKFNSTPNHQYEPN
jgi:hypothetical protein